MQRADDATEDQAAVEVDLQRRGRVAGNVGIKIEGEAVAGSTVHLHVLPPYVGAEVAVDHQVIPRTAGRQYGIPHGVVALQFGIGGHAVGAVQTGAALRQIGGKPYVACFEIAVEHQVVGIVRAIQLTGRGRRKRTVGEERLRANRDQFADRTLREPGNVERLRQSRAVRQAEVDLLGVKSGLNEGAIGKDQGTRGRHILGRPATICRYGGQLGAIEVIEHNAHGILDLAVVDQIDGPAALLQRKLFVEGNAQVEQIAIVYDRNGRRALVGCDRLQFQKADRTGGPKPSEQE